MKKSPQKRLSDFGQKRRFSSSAKTYSFFVRIMKLTLPLLAIVIMGLLLSWPRVEDTFESVPTDVSMPPILGKNELLKARFESSDEKKQPFSVTAERAVQSTHDPSIVLLERPMADMTLADGTWLAAEAENGQYRQKEDKLLLQGNVRFFHDQGYEMRTEKLLLDLKNYDAWSDQPVSGHGAAGSLKATGLQAKGETNILIFTGPVTLVLNRDVKGLE